MPDNTLCQGNATTTNQPSRTFAAKNDAQAGLFRVTIRALEERGCDESGYIGEHRGGTHG